MVRWESSISLPKRRKKRSSSSAQIWVVQSSQSRCGLDDLGEAAIVIGQGGSCPTKELGDGQTRRERVSRVGVSVLCVLGQPVTGQPVEPM